MRTLTRVCPQDANIPNSKFSLDIASNQRFAKQMSRTTFSANCIDGPAKAGACWPPHRSLHIYRMYKLNYTAEDAQALKPPDIAKPGVKLASGFASDFGVCTDRDKYGIGEHGSNDETHFPNSWLQS